MIAHTPGPWRAKDRDVMVGRFRVVHGCTAGGAAKGMLDDIEISRANARLIAAAPELLALLIESQDSIGGDWRERRDAAIAKALGSQP